jgi:hypothetical protein
VQLGYADVMYQGPRIRQTSPIRIEIVRKPEGQVGFAVHTRRWAVERFLAWINRNRRLAKDFEASIASAEAFLYAAPLCSRSVERPIDHAIQHELLQCLRITDTLTTGLLGSVPAATAIQRKTANGQEQAIWPCPQMWARPLQLAVHITGPSFAALSG